MSETIDNSNEVEQHQRQNNPNTIDTLSNRATIEDIAKSQVIRDFIDDATLKIVEAFEESNDDDKEKEKANLTPEKKCEKSGEENIAENTAEESRKISTEKQSENIPEKSSKISTGNIPESTPEKSRVFSAETTPESTPEKSSIFAAENTAEKEVIKAKKSVSFNPNDEKIRKFTAGEPIVDQQNPFKHSNGTQVASGGKLEPKKTPPPVPTKRSTLSIRKTVTQQLREREREKEKEREKADKLKEKEREQLKNRKNATKGTTPVDDEYITTEEVLKQSKYVKTYIKNPDPYFEYDPTVLARIKFEELRELAGKIPKRKQSVQQQQQQQTPQATLRYNKTARNPPQQQQPQLEAANKPKTLTFKKCSKPNYPELAQLKIRTGIAEQTNGNYFNAAEVTKNAKKFDERVKKLQISSDDDLDDIDGPLTKSESSDELNPNITSQTSSGCASDTTTDDGKSPRQSPKQQQQPTMGTFTNTISSEEFQAYLERKGLTLMPKREINSPTPRSTPTRSSSGYHTAEERRQQVADSLAALRKSNTKKLTVLQRLSNSLFAPRRKQTPKVSDATAMPQPMRRIQLESQQQQPQAQQQQQPTPLQRGSLERQSLIPRRVETQQQPQRFNRSASMDRNQMRERREQRENGMLLGQQQQQRRSLAAPNATSTPLKMLKQPQQQQQPQHEWEQLRAIKEVTDRQLYHKVLQQQQQQQQQQVENIYEHLQPNQLINPYFVRNSMQRNTFSGISNGRNRQVMILDGTPIVPLQQQQQLPQQQQQPQQQQPQQQPPRCQSVLDELISSNSNQQLQQSRQTLTRRGYESENEATPVIMRRKDSKDASTRRIGGLLTRDEILEKVKEFCRKSIQRTPQPAIKMQPIYEQRHNSNHNTVAADISPVSYASVETHKRPVSQLSVAARPQVPQRVQSLPRSSFAPISVAVGSSSPIYAHVNKRNSLLSNESNEPAYLSRQPTEYVLIQTEDGLQAAKLIDFQQHQQQQQQQQLHQSNLYMQPQLLRTAPQGYVRMEELALAQHQQQLQQQQQQQQLQLQQQQQQLLQQHLQNGRATPLILDRSTQHASQIYWTPQHQRLNQLSLPKSRGYPVPAPRLQLPHNVNYVQQQQQQQQQQPRSLQQQNNRSSDWDCSSEAGEVRRIMEKSL